MMMTTYWKPEPVSANDGVLTELMESAGQELAQENATLSELIEKAATQTSKGHDAAYGRAGRGLSYWLYEDTLVYLVWKAWVRLGKAVAWDWTVRDLRGSRPERPQNGDKQKIDLVVFGSDAAPRIAIEAKWWNLASAVPAMLADADKLADSQVLAGSDKYLMAFWWDLSSRMTTWPDAVGKVTQRRPGLTYCGHVAFPAAFFGCGRHVPASEGRFAIGMIRVTS